MHKDHYYPDLTDEEEYLLDAHTGLTVASHFCILEG